MDLICVCAVWVASFTTTSDGSETSGTSFFAPFGHPPLAYRFFHTAGRKCRCQCNAVDQVTTRFFVDFTPLQAYPSNEVSPVRLVSTRLYESTKPNTSKTGKLLWGSPSWRVTHTGIPCARIYPLAHSRMFGLHSVTATQLVVMLFCRNTCELPESNVWEIRSLHSGYVLAVVMMKVRQRGEFKGS